jgi:hypothetical protein
LWLVDWDVLLSKSRALEVVQLYQSLAPLLCCMDAADKLRALCPLLAAVPIEGHFELLVLIRRLKEAAGVRYLDELGEKLLMHRTNSRGRHSQLIFPHHRLPRPAGILSRVFTRVSKGGWRIFPA